MIILCEILTNHILLREGGNLKSPIILDTLGLSTQKEKYGFQLYRI